MLQDGPGERERRVLARYARTAVVGPVLRTILDAARGYSGSAGDVRQNGQALGVGLAAAESTRKR